MSHTLLVSGCRDQPSVRVNHQQQKVQETVVTNAEWPPDRRRDDQYVGSVRCAECHQDISREYFSSHPMGQSVKVPDELDAVARSSVPATLDAGGRHYAVTMDGEVLKQSESMSDKVGLIYTQSCSIDFAIGSGTRGYSFVSERDGCLYQSPLTWYSQEKMWDLSPGYDPDDHPRFGRRMSDGCIVCHAGRANRLPSATDRFKTPVFLEATIGCERCHGPGEQHVAFQSGDPSPGESDRIVNPAKLEPSRRDSVCYQCHLHGRDRILRTARSEYDFRPGDRLSDVWVAFVNTPSADSSSTQLKAVSQVEQMVASKCYTKSDGLLGCISCHNPHRTPSPEEKVEFYRNNCLKCHTEAGHDCSLPLVSRLQTSAEDSCIQCHMPPAAATDVPHTAQTDHRVLRMYDAATAEEVAPTLDVFERATQPVPTDEIQRAYGLKLKKNIRSRSDAATAMDLLAPTLHKGVDDGPVLAAAAWLLIQLGDLQAARKLAEHAVAFNPENESALEALVVISETEKDYNSALGYLDRTLKLAPWDWQLQAKKAALLEVMEMTDQASKVWKEVLSINPLVHSARRSYIKVLSATGKESEANRQTELLNRLLAAEAQEKLSRASNSTKSP